MSAWFAEIDHRTTPLGDLILQRRRIAALANSDIYEVKLGGAYLMSSLFYSAEEELARLTLRELDGGPWDVVVGGLGLGYTAAEALRSPLVRRLTVVEALSPVIDWHRQGLVPNGKILTEDPRCVYQCADFFALARGEGFDSETPGFQFHAVLLDIDHAPNHFLSPAHADFYEEAGLLRLQRFLKPGGVFGLWSNDPPDAAFLAALAAVFPAAQAQVVSFVNPLMDQESTNTIYVAKKA